jgi:hypothetical protein
MTRIFFASPGAAFLFSETLARRNAPFSPYPRRNLLSDSPRAKGSLCVFLSPIGSRKNVPIPGFSVVNPCSRH